MTPVPDLWWSPTEGLFLQRFGAPSYLPLLDGREQPLIGRRSVSVLPEDAVRLCADGGTDYIRVGETVSTEDRSDTYRLASGPQAMYLEPVDTNQPHVIEIAEHAWTMKHPVTCRAKLFHCKVHQAALKSEPLGDKLGRFVCGVGYSGYLVIGEPTT